MEKIKRPNTTQANTVYAFVILATFIGSILLQPRLGLGGNLWVNELIYILLPALFLLRLNKWSAVNTFRFKKTTPKNKLLGVAIGISVWFVTAPVAVVTRIFLDRAVGPIDLAADNVSPSQIVLLLLGTIVLAPICEETLFRGFMLPAYEKYGRKQALVFSSVLFGVFHVLNGINSVMPAVAIGLVFGYLTYRTGSIYPAILAHGANNFSALFGFLIVSGVPWWFWPVSVGALIMLFVLFRKLDAQEQGEHHTEMAQGPKPSKLSTFLLVLSLLFLLAISVIEILIRAKIMEGF